MEIAGIQGSLLTAIWPKGIPTQIQCFYGTMEDLNELKRSFYRHFLMCATSRI